MRIIALFFSAVLLISCGKEHEGSYLNLPHEGAKILSTNVEIIDTLKIDGSTSSLDGMWLVNNDKLYYCDRLMVSIKSFDCDGKLIGRIIRSGRGPGEWYSPLVAGCFDDRGCLYCIDGAWNILCFDPNMNLSPEVNRLFASSYESQDWNYLYRHPDAEIPSIYEYNIENGGLAAIGNTIIAPVVTDHIKYNGYNIIAKSKKFWKDSYNMMSVDINKKMNIVRMFSHFPAFYQKGNYPIYSKYSFDVRNDEEIIVSYMADPNMYVFNADGDLQRCIGFPSACVSTESYLQTKTFEEYEREFKTRIKKASYYGNITCSGDYLFRTYKCEDNNGYGVQVYFHDDMICDFHTHSEWTVFGAIEDVFYAYIPSNYETEEFNLIRFSLNNKQ